MLPLSCNLLAGRRDAVSALSGVEFRAVNQGTGTGKRDQSTIAGESRI